MSMFKQIAPGKTGKCKGDEERTCDGKELPTLLGYLPCALLQGKAKKSGQQIKPNQLCQSDRKVFRRFERKNHKQPVADKRQVCSQQSGEEHQPDGSGLTHARRLGTKRLDDAAN